MSDEPRILFRPSDPRDGNEWMDLGAGAKLAFTVKVEPLDDLRAMSEMIAKAAVPLSYLVLDHAMDHTTVERGTDSHGKHYARLHPSLMDLLPQGRREDRPLHERFVSLATTGVPVYRREDLPDGWPDA